MRALLVMAVLGFAWLAPAPAQALNCIPLIGCTCNVAASGIGFADFNPLAAGDEAAIGAIEINCSGVLNLGGTVTVEILQGQWGTYAARKMRAPSGDMIDYNIYTTSAHTQVWGAGAQAQVINGDIFLLGAWSANRDMFARLVANPAMKPGDYTDTVTVRIIW